MSDATAPFLRRHRIRVTASPGEAREIAPFLLTSL
jgi:hypothetical protein